MCQTTQQEVHKHPTLTSTSNFPLGNIGPSYLPGSESNMPGLSTSFLEDLVSVFFSVNTNAINEGTGGKSVMLAPAIHTIIDFSLNTTILHDVPGILHLIYLLTEANFIQRSLRIHTSNCTPAWLAIALQIFSHVLVPSTHQATTRHQFNRWYHNIPISSMPTERTAKLGSRRSPYPTMVWVWVQAHYSSNTTGWWNVQKEILCNSKHHFSLGACANTFLNTGYHGWGLFPWTCVQGSAIHHDWPFGIKSTVEWDYLLLGPAGWDCSPPCPSASEVGSSLWVPPPAQIYTHIWHHCSTLLFLLLLWFHEFVPQLAGGLVRGNWNFWLHCPCHRAVHLPWLYTSSRIQRGWWSCCVVSNYPKQYLSGNPNQSGASPPK